MPQNSFVLPEAFSIPTMPAVANRISTMLQDPNVGLREVAAVVAQDAPLAAKVLKIANSSFYGLRERCMSTQQAASILGIKVLKNVVLQAAVIRQFDHLKGSGIDLNDLWRHAIVTAQTCAFLTQRAQRKILISAEEAYVCGLLHDLGQVVMIDNLKDFYVKVMKRAKSEHIPLFLAEQQALGFTHADVGGRVATMWGLPQTVVHAITLHHGPDAEAAREPVVSLILCTNLLVERVSAGNAAAASGLFATPIARPLGINSEVETAAIEFVAGALKAVEI
ncbi:MAG: HDOD domain-containing protein [Planctomycetes bacterium]|nr:HDOD domain-containing protein [Planctomycetota bacterium]